MVARMDERHDAATAVGLSSTLHRNETEVPLSRATRIDLQHGLLLLGRRGLHEFLERALVHLQETLRGYRSGSLSI